MEVRQLANDVEILGIVISTTVSSGLVNLKQEYDICILGINAMAYLICSYRCHFEKLARFDGIFACFFNLLFICFMSIFIGGFPRNRVHYIILSVTFVISHIFFFFFFFFFFGKIKLFHALTAPLY